MSNSELLKIEDPLLPVVRARVWGGSYEARQWFEDSAERWAIREHLRRRRECLFWVEPYLGDQARWPAFNDQWCDKSVAVFSEGRFTQDHIPYVGVCYGIRPGFFGAALVIAHFGAQGSTTHASPLGVYDMFELPPEFSEPPGRWDDGE